MTAMTRPPQVRTPRSATKRPSVGRSNRASTALWGAGGFLILLAIGEILPRAGILPAEEFPPSSATLARMAQVFTDPDIRGAVLDTAQGWAIGVLIAAILGIVGGILIGMSPLLNRSLRFTIEFLRPIPPIVLIPLAIVIWGPTQTMKIFLVALGALWPILYQTMYGVRDVDHVLLDTAKVFAVPYRRRVLGITLPAATPLIVTGLRIGATLGLIVAVATELVGGAPGLGQQILVAQFAGQYVDLYALVAIAGVFGLCVNSLLRLVERRLLVWHVSQRLER